MAHDCVASEERGLSDRLRNTQRDRRPSRPNMSADSRWIVEGGQGDDILRATEPTPDEIVSAAPLLAAFYNESHNRAMLAHTGELSPDEVVAYYEDLRADGSHPFLLWRQGVLAGDADFRNIRGGTAEFAILIGDRGTQGRGIGTRFAVMLHAFAFRILDLARVYVSIIPGNAASRRLFARVGYRIDDSPEARDYVDEDSDVTMSIDRDVFAARARGRVDAAHADTRFFGRDERI